MKKVVLETLRQKIKDSENEKCTLRQQYTEELEKVIENIKKVKESDNREKEKLSDLNERHEKEVKDIEKTLKKKKKKRKDDQVEKQKLVEIIDKYKVEVKAIENTLKTSEKEMKYLVEFRDELEKDMGLIGDRIESAKDTGVEAAQSQLECPVCLEMMKPPIKIWMCPQTHLVCEECREGMVNKVCPTCSVMFPMC